MKSPLTPQQIQIMKDDLSIELAEMLIDEFHYSPQEALDVLYTSDTFERLQDDETGLYYQSAGYVYSFLSDEINTPNVA
ncbi:MAG: hypothetical protein IIU48_05950 [Prevotella sp.]|nr:hypothetical protein [Prevotella sp.]MBQ5378045.1 hypothetical protein [Prevotella sp.]